MIETRSQELAASLLDRVQNSRFTQNYRQNVPPEELKERIYEIYRHLGEWLIGKDKLNLEQRYLQIGARRAVQQVPVSEVIWVIVLTKGNLWEFIRKEAVLASPAEILGEMEMLQLLEQFFDRAIYYAAVGYELADHPLKDPSAPSKQD
ncbi:MAG: hypothetical protein ACHP8B_17500 [Terriglobales bacterium]